MCSFPTPDAQQLHVRKITSGIDPRWETFVEQHPDGSIYHHPNWLAALEREYRRESVCLICEDSGGELRGIFPLMYTRGIPCCKGWSLGCARLSSLPRTPQAGPLAIDSAAATLLLQEAMHLASREPRIHLQIKPPGRDLAGLVDGVVETPWRNTYLLQLNGDSGTPFRISNKKHRVKVTGAVNKALASGLCARLAETEADLYAWYRAYLETMRRNVVPARPHRFFLALWQLMRPKGQMRLWLAEYKNKSGTKIVGGHIYLYFGQTMYYAFNGVYFNALFAHPNDLLLWQAINDAQSEGRRVVDFGEVPEGNDTLVRFKLKWGAEPVRLYRYYFPDYADTKHVSIGKAKPLVAAGMAMWRHLPLKVTAQLGDRIYAWL